MKKDYYIEPPESEAQYQILMKMAKQLGIPVPMSFLEMRVTLPNGKTVHRHKQRAHSYTRNMYNILFSAAAACNFSSSSFGAGYISLKSQAGTVYNVSSGVNFSTKEGSSVFNYSDLNTATSDTYRGGIMPAATYTTWGILVGSGTNAEDFEGYVLQTLIAHGTGAGQLAYGDTQSHSLSYVAGTKTLSDTISRYMNNNSSGDVSVNEVGLYARLGVGSYVNGPFMISRDKLGATVTVPATGQLKVTYTTSLVYPA